MLVGVLVIVGVGVGGVVGVLVTVEVIVGVFAGGTVGEGGSISMNVGVGTGVEGGLQAPIRSAKTPKERRFRNATWCVLHMTTS